MGNQQQGGYRMWVGMWEGVGVLSKGARCAGVCTHMCEQGVGAHKPNKRQTKHIMCVCPMRTCTCTHTHTLAHTHAHIHHTHMPAPTCMAVATTSTLFSTPSPNPTCTHTTTVTVTTSQPQPQARGVEAWGPFVSQVPDVT